MEDKISELKDELSIVETEIKWRGHKCTSCGKKTSRAQYTAMGTFVNNVITCSHGYYGSNEIMGYNNTYSASGSPGGESCPYFRDMYEKRERLKEEIEELNSTIIYAPREEETENETAKPKKAISVNTTAEALTERGFIFLEDSEWETAKDYFDNALDINPKYGQAYIGLLCAELKIKSESKIKKLKEPLDNNPNYQKALRFSDTQYKAQITSYNQAIHDGIKEKQYKELVNAKMLVKTKSKSLHELEYQYLAQQFRAMDGYKDTLTLSEECDEQYRTMKETREKVQLEEIRKMEEETRKKEEQTRKKYRVLWERLSDEGKARAGERRKAAQAKLDEENEKAKAAHEAEYQRSVNEYQLNHEKWQATVANIKAEQEAKLSSWQAEVNRIKAENDTLHRRWQEEVAAAQTQSQTWKSQGLCPHCGIGKIGFFGSCKECKRKGDEAINVPLPPGYIDYPSEPALPYNMPPEPVKPQQKAFTPRQLKDETTPTLPADVTATIKGEHVYVKMAGIDWLVLAVEEEKVLLISEKVLEKRPYHKVRKDITWENCDLRKYLNDEFYNRLGTAKGAVAETKNSNPNNPWYETKGGSSTTDKVFLLSLDEVVRYFGDSGDLKNKRRKDSSGKLNSNGYYFHSKFNSARRAKYKNGEECWWWLRSPGGRSTSAAVVGNIGSVDVDGNFVGNATGVRPTLWLNL